MSFEIISYAVIGSVVVSFLVVACINHNHREHQGEHHWSRELLPILVYNIFDTKKDIK